MNFKRLGLSAVLPALSAEGATEGKVDFDEVEIEGLEEL